MTAAGDAVLAVARSTVGMAEDPPGSNAGPWWDWYGTNYGSWCASAVSWWCDMAGVPMCPVDSGKGFILVSNGTVHSYQAFEQSQEAQPTVALEPGDVVLFSWYSWTWSGGVPIITDPEWAGWIAGDHTGVVAVPPDGSGYFTAVEGNTSGGVVAERSDRHISQVCGWWRPLNYGETGGGAPEPEPPPPPNSVERDAMFIMWSDRGAMLIGAGYQKWLTPEEVDALIKIPGMVSYTAPNQFEFDCIGGATFNGESSPPR